MTKNSVGIIEVQKRISSIYISPVIQRKLSVESIIAIYKQTFMGFSLRLTEWTYNIINFTNSI